MISTFVRADRLRLAMLFRSKEETRYYLNGVAIQPNGNGVRVCGTDGHRVAMFQDDAGFTDQPHIVLVPKVVCQLIKQAKHRDQTWFALMGGAGFRREGCLFDAEVAGLGELVEIRQAMENVGSDGVLWAGPVDLIDGVFPDVAAVVPAKRANNGHVATFNSKYIADFGAVAGDLDRAASGPVRVYPAENQAALVDCGRPDFVGVIMPMQQQTLALEAAVDHVLPPLWARGEGNADSPAPPAPEAVKAAEKLLKTGKDGHSVSVTIGGETFGKPEDAAALVSAVGGVIDRSLRHA